jgi:AraC-like DNA-binding protein
VRNTLALNLLENETLALTEIALSLGYSEVSAFNHASGAGSANRRAIIVDYARFVSNPPQRRARSRQLRGRFE